MRGVHKRRRKWWFRFTHDGTQRLVNTGQEDEAEAIKVAQRILSRPDDFLDGSTELEALLKDYLRQKKLRGISQAHRDNENWTIARFLQDTGINRARSITPKLVADWLAPHVENNAKTANDYHDRLRRFCRWLVANGRLVSNPCDEIPRVKKRPKPRRRFLTVAESKKLLDACEDPELKTALFLAIHAGLRKGECLAARWSWVDFRAGLLHVTVSEDWSPKDDEDRTIPLSGPLADWFKGRKAEKQDPGAFLCWPEKGQGAWRNRKEFRKPFGALCKRCGLDDVTFHDLRRTFASLHVISGTPLYVVAKWLGDGHAVVERHYAHLIAADERINGPWNNG